MDAFKELQKRAPDVSLMDLTDLHSTVFWSGAAFKVIQTKIETAREIGGMQSQVDAWLLEGQAITEHKTRAQQRLGVIAYAEDQDRPQRGATRESTSSNEPKWQRLGEIAKDTKKTTVIGKGIGLGSIPSGEPLKWQRLGFKSENAVSGFLARLRAFAKRGTFTCF